MLVEVWGYDSSVWSGDVAAGAWAEACRLQRPLPDGSLQVGLWGEKQDGAMELAKIWLGRQACRTRGCRYRCSMGRRIGRTMRRR
jgi:hypothetical protein